MSTNMVAVFLIFVMIPSATWASSTSAEMDWTAGVEIEQKRRMLQVAKLVTSNLPSGTEEGFSFVADRNIKVKTLDDIFLDVSYTSSYTITASAIEDGISGSFPNGKLKMKAEILFLLVDVSTPIDIPSIVLRKKTTVIVFGTSVPGSLRRVASSDNHIHLVRNNDDIYTVAERIRNQTCIDSQYVCDVDMYKENRRYSGCKDCLNVCSEKQVADAGCSRCPYMRLPPKAHEVKDELAPATYIKDNKKSYIIAISVSFTTICVVCMIPSSLYICYRRKVACFGQDPPENPTDGLGGQRIPNSRAVAEVGEEDIPAAVHGHDIPLLPHDRTQPGPHNGEDGDMDGCQEHGYINLRHSDSACGVEETTL